MKKSGENTVKFYYSCPVNTPLQIPPRRKTKKPILGTPKSIKFFNVSKARENIQYISRFYSRAPKTHDHFCQSMAGEEKIFPLKEWWTNFSTYECHKSQFPFVIATEKKAFSRNFDRF